jgi:prevent-host-death family protein
VRKAGVAELKNHLSRYLDHVRAGETVLVLDRQRPVARLVPLAGRPAARGQVDERLIQLECEGLIRRGTGGRPAWLRGRRPLRVRGSVLRDLLEERESSR